MIHCLVIHPPMANGTNNILQLDVSILLCAVTHSLCRVPTQITGSSARRPQLGSFTPRVTSCVFIMLFWARYMMFSVKAGGFYRSNSAHAGQLLYFYLKCKNVSIEDQLRQVSKPAEPVDSPLMEEKTARCPAALQPFSSPLLKAFP